MHVRVRDVNEETCNLTALLVYYYMHCAVQRIPCSPCCCYFAYYKTTRPAIASHNLARFNPGINPGIPGLSKLTPEIPGLAKLSGIAFPSPEPMFGNRKFRGPEKLCCPDDGSPKFTLFGFGELPCCTKAVVLLVFNTLHRLV